METTFSQFSTLPKEERYEQVLPLIKSLIKGEEDPVTLLANTCAALKEVFGWFWVGFYMVKDGQLHLGPFQGPVACTRIAKGRGVCGAAWEKAETMVVEDVDAFPGHIACSSLSRSEIVVPLIRKGEVLGVLDIDSEKLATFNAIDKRFLEELMAFAAEGLECY